MRALRRLLHTGPGTRLNGVEGPGTGHPGPGGKKEKKRLLGSNFIVCSTKRSEQRQSANYRRRAHATAAVTRLSPAADGTSDGVSSTSGGAADGVARAKSEVVPVVGGARHVEAAGAADGIDGLVHLAAGTALGSGSFGECYRVSVPF